VLAGWLFRRKFVPIHQVYTFGGPMVGNAEAVASLDRELPGKVFRFVNSPDPVPRLPTISLIANRYAHCGAETLLGAVAATGEAATATAGTALDLFTQLASKTVDGVLNATLIDDLWTTITKRIAAHDLANYSSLIAALPPRAEGRRDA
jgi:hypothetical protein